jgi:hypothetical protein
MTQNISTNTVFHFTKSIDNIENILKNDFYPMLCVEDIFGTIAGIQNVEKAIAMVCFCDIPLYQVQKHIKTYGEYAIGLSKDWAIRKKINPVLYTYPTSDLANQIKRAFFDLIRHEREIGISERDAISNNLKSLIQYVKPYEGFLWRDGHWSKEKIRFYDEREWRFIPDFKDENGVPVVLRIDNSSNKDYGKILQDLNRDTPKLELRLSFEPNDIKFIIVKNDSEILPMIDKVITINRDKFSYRDVHVWTTRIISMESIKENF